MFRLKCGVFYVDMLILPDIGAHDGKPVRLGNYREPISYAAAHHSWRQPLVPVGTITTGRSGVSPAHAERPPRKPRVLQITLYHNWPSWDNAQRRYQRHTTW